MIGTWEIGRLSEAFDDKSTMQIACDLKKNKAQLFTSIQMLHWQDETLYLFKSEASNKPHGTVNQQRIMDTS